MAESGLFSTYFYHRITRKMVVALGALFKDIQMIRYTQDGSTELERMVVPLMFGTKERWLLRIQQDPDLSRSVQVVVPRISFEITGIEYDSNRQQQKLLSTRGVIPGVNNAVYRQYVGTPFNWDFRVSVYVRNIEDGFQIIEQILTMLTPDYTLPIVVDSSIPLRTNVPVVFRGMNIDIQDEGDGDEKRLVTFDLSFTAKGYLVGPTSNVGIIMQANTNFYDITQQGGGDRTFAINTIANTGSGNTFSTGEYVYQGGASLATSNVKAVVVEHNPSINRLWVKNPTDTQGRYATFKVNTTIKGASSGSTRNVSSYYVSFVPVAIGVVTPRPNTANSAADAYGFNTQIKETPNIP